MYQIAVASGKGGAGKTSISAALASWLGNSAISCDCDVDAANTALAMEAVIQSSEIYYSGTAWEIQQSSCTGCGRCVPVCHFGAIHMQKTLAVIDEALCERCGNCVGVCPSAAFKPVQKTGGELFISKTANGSLLVHAELLPGEDTSGKLVRAVRQKAEELATDQQTFCIIDAPPGIGCPVIAALQGCNLAIVVIEAGQSGIRDAKRLFELLASMKRPHASIINKTGIDAGADTQARQLAEHFGSRILAELPYDKRFREATEQGIAWHTCTDSFVAEHSRCLCTTVIQIKENFMIKAIPTDDKQTVSKVFGRAKWFALYKDGSKEAEFLDGSGNAEHGAGTGAAASLIEKAVQQVFAAEVGPKAYDALVAGGVHISIVKAGTALADLV